MNPSTPERTDSWLGRRGIQDKFTLAFTVILLLFMTATFLFTSSLRDVRKAHDWQEHSSAVLVKLNHLETGVINEQAGLRGYLMTFNPEFLAPYHKGIEQFEQDSQALRVLTADNPQIQVGLVQVARLMEDWRREFAAPMLALAAGAQRDPEGTIRRVRAEAAKGRGKQIIDQIRVQLDELRQLENALLDQRTATLDQTLRRTEALSLVMLCVGISFGILMILLVGRTVSRPIAQLTTLMSRLANGDTAIEIPYKPRGDEIGAMARRLEVFKASTVQLQEREWVKTESARLSMLLQQCVDESSFCITLSRELARLLGAPGVAVFLCSEHEPALYFGGGQGVPDELYTQQRFVLGQGLVGECAQQQQSLLIRDVPPGYFRIHSGLVSGTPDRLLLSPLMGRDGVLAVLEMALLREDHPALLAEVLPLAGLTLDTLRRSLATKLLLAQTQEQKEELQASEETLRIQQEELRATNEALEDKARALQEQSQKLTASDEELRLANQALQEKAAALEEARHAVQRKANDLEQASQYKSEFLANMSHELRTPLNSLLILSKSLASNEDGNLDDEQIESARIIHESGSNLLRLINDILDLSKVEAGKMDIVTEEVSLSAFAATMERNFRPMAQQRSLKWEVLLSPELPTRIRTDGARLAQILTNLLSNAFKFTHQGGVRLHIARPAATDLPEGSPLRAEQAIAFRVSDSGIGIPEEKLARIFQAFEQADTSTSRRYGGTGLGLSICRGLAQLLGGEIRVSSQPEKGSAFTLYLPEQLPGAVRAAASAPQQTALAPSDKPAPPARKSRRSKAAAGTSAAASSEVSGDRILIVEDDPQFSEVLAGIARRKGLEVLTAQTGEDGWRLARSQQPSGILLDIGLPGAMDGWKLMEKLKADPQTRNIPVHFISGDDQAKRALDMGAVGFLLKPVEKEAVLGALTRLLHFSHERRQLLVVDDDAASRAAVRQLLGDALVDISEANDGAAGLALLQKQSFDCLILDLGLPDMSGLEFLRQATATMPQLPPVVVYSARELTREESMQLREFTDSIVIKGARSPDRLLDEVTLFLHAINKPQSTPAMPAPAAPGLAGKSVLVVDDDMRNIFALSKVLRGQGLKVIMAQDGYKALAQLEQQPGIDLVLMDIMMPGMDGYECMRRIRAQPQWQKLPIIAVTAKAMKGDREKCLQAGANDYCTKPVDVDQLLVQMRALLA
jgi:CheY-like chemotaxis protein/CHASE3 domain sensor protein